MRSARSRTKKTSAVATSFAIAGVLALLTAGCGSSSKSTGTGSGTTTGSGSTNATTATTTSGGATQAPTGSPIKIGFIYSATGGASSSYVDSEFGAQARVDQQNAEGGVNGHPLQVVVADDTSTPSGNLTAAQELVQTKQVFGVIEDSSLAFGGTKYLSQQKIPVTGAAVDGPEWAQQPNTNMFSVSVPDDGPVAGANYTYTNVAQFMKSIGITELAGLGINVESAIQATDDALYAASLEGIKTCYKDISIPFGDVNFTPVSLAIKAAGCNGVYGLFGIQGNVALSTAVKQAGIQAKQLYATSYDQNIIDSPSALSASQQDYTEVSSINFTNPNAAAKTMLASLAKYTAFKGGIPSLNIVFGYLSADLMIKGLQLAGQTPTRQAFISQLRGVSSYDAGGLLSSPLTFTGFGTLGMLPPTQCGYFVQIVGKSFVPVPANGQPICGNRVKVP
jgi:ABC-type branched-subunit amino acid transport system substrate-binding protein